MVVQHKFYSRRPHKLLVVVISLVLFVLAVGGLNSVSAMLEIPGYRGYVNDYAEMISASTESKLNSALAAFEKSDSTQIAVLTISSLEGQSIEEYGIKVAENWGVGHKNLDNGALLLIAEAERKIRIEVGRGLEPVLTDYISGRIIDNIISPNFKSGNFDQGFVDGVKAMIEVCRGEFSVDQVANRTVKGVPKTLWQMTNGEPTPLFKFLFFGVVVVLFLGNIMQAIGLVAGAFLFPTAFVFGIEPVLQPLSVFLLMPLTAAIGWFVPPILAKIFQGGTDSSYNSGGYGGGYYGGGYGGSSGGYGGGFGGFGGGGFGGGGASGGW